MNRPSLKMKRAEPGTRGGRRLLIMRAVVIIIAIAAVVFVVKIKGADGDVEFTQLTDEAIPQEISSEIIPEYRDMERALACVADDKVYVLAMRGEKPTTGYDISIESMSLSTEKTDGTDESTLTVNVLFTDPQAGASLTQAQTYPYAAAETNLKELPDKIEMKIKYAD